MNTDSYWRASQPLPRFSKVESDIESDVVVIGGGITGITTAYLLKRLGKKVILLERDRCVEGDSGATSAHLTCVTDLRLSELVRKWGKDHATAIWDAGLAAIDQIEEIVGREKIACGFQRVPGYLHAPLTSEASTLSKKFEEEAELAMDLGFHASFVPSAPLMDRPGMHLPNQAIFQPVSYLRGLLEAINGGGSFIYEHSEVSEFLEKPFRVKVNSHTVKAKHFVIATHVPLMGNNGLVSATLFQSKLASYSSYVIGGRVTKGAVPTACFWDTSDPYYFLRVDPHRDYDYVIFGGEDHKTGQDSDTTERYQRLEAVLKSIVPKVAIDHRWSGQVVETNDGLPFIGELGEHQFVGTGYAGNGLTFGTVAAMMAVDWVNKKKNPWTDLFDVHRKKVLGGTWDYLKENMDYPYYLLKDRLSRAERSGVETVEKGDGRVLKLDGKRMAVARDENGKLHICSAICTHMGCVVHWNAAEKTWDCPCHGSRFKLDGQVLSGPAEEPLATQ